MVADVLADGVSHVVALKLDRLGRSATRPVRRVGAQTCCREDDDEEVCQNCGEPIGDEEYEVGDVEVSPGDQWTRYYYPDAAPGVPFRVYRHERCAEEDC